MLNQQEKYELGLITKNVRKNILKMIHNAQSGHTGGSLSGVEILTTLYFKCLNIPITWDNDKNFEQRDRFILSKGHATPLLYSVLSQVGLIKEDELFTFRTLNSRLQGHPSKKFLDEIETSTGSLGQGLSIACGMALGLKLKNNNNSRVIVYTGDGELQEGSCWEAFMQAAHRKLDNLICIIDRNGLQIDGCTENVMALGDLKSKLESFDWFVQTIDGHDFDEIISAYNDAKENKESPSVIIANTIKGKGISFMENQASWHGKAPNDEQLINALAELEN